ncbi:MAG: hypothetical protein N2691_02160 [Patescibacteria group bacterium]|nr:hypothetical protein [Patescibacteria group bacterium]
MEISELRKITDAFVEELDMAQRGNKTSLPFIVNQFPDHPLVPEHDDFLVLVIGGTIFQVARCRKEHGQILILRKRAGELVAFSNKDTFLRFVEELIPDDVKYVAVNFAYPLSPLFKKNKLDGILISGTKEHTFDGLVGLVVGDTIEAYLKEKRGQVVTVSTANDTICELLSGVSKASRPEFLACGIVGTGVNFAFFMDSHHAVNLEAANFNKFPQSKYGKKIDEHSQHPNQALFEKETSGGYLFQHMNLFSEEHGLDLKLKSSKELDDYAKKCEVATEGDACAFAWELLDRSAGLVACQIAGITRYKAADMIFIMAGSLFWKAFNYKESVSKYVKILVPEYNVTFITIENCEIYGAARLVA